MKTFLFQRKINGKVLESFPIEANDLTEAMKKAPHLYGGAGGEWHVTELTQ